MLNWVYTLTIQQFNNKNTVIIQYLFVTSQPIKTLNTLNRTTMRISYLLCALLFAGCTTQPPKDLVANNFDFAAKQLNHSFKEIQIAQAEETPQQMQKRLENNRGALMNPRNIENDGKLRLVVGKDWCSGFYPGELWYMYQYTGDSFWADKANEHTMAIAQEQFDPGTHDLGFKMYCSFGNGLRLTGNESYKPILMQAAHTLISRYKPAVGCIRSWDHNRDKWQCPVIIDNMMNLELLMWAFKNSGDSTFYQIAVSHADTTIKNHFREDFSTFHVVDYDTITGVVLNRHTHQGFAHESAWARGQAWGLYGYTMMYRETQLPQYREQAKQIANFIFTHKNMPEDLIPYWDFNAPNIPNEPRDVSAATVSASALYELSMYDPHNAAKYKAWADKILSNITTNYRATVGKDRGFLTLHSTGHLPRKSEIDVPIVYADYYYLEALLRKANLEKNGSTLFN